MSSPETQTAHNRFLFLVEAVAWRYRAQGFAVRREVRAKLLSDPFYRALVTSNWLPAEGKVLDLGCGRGVFLSLVASATAMGMSGSGRRGLAIDLTGVESHPELAESAKQALSGLAELITGNVLDIALPPCRTALLQDVLLYLTPAEQNLFLERLVESLEPGGLILLREPDASGFGMTSLIKLLAKTASVFRRETGKHPYPRSAKEWESRLASLGLQVESRPLPEADWLRQSLILARKPDASAN